MEENLGFIIPVVTIAVGVVIGIVAISVAKRSRMRERQIVCDLAALLGLEAIDAEASLRKAYEDAGQGALLAKLEKLPAPILRFILANAPWRLEGERDGVRVSVFSETRSTGRTSTTYTVVRAFYRQDLEYELSITHEGALFKLGKALFGLKDVELGDPELDPLIRVKAGDPIAAKLLFGGGARDALASAAQAYKEFRATASYAHWERRGVPTEAAAGAAEIGAVLDLLVPVAKAIGG